MLRLIYIWTLYIYIHTQIYIYMCMNTHTYESWAESSQSLPKETPFVKVLQPRRRMSHRKDAFKRQLCFHQPCPSQVPETDSPMQVARRSPQSHKLQGAKQAIPHQDILSYIWRTCPKLFFLTTLNLCLHESRVWFIKTLCHIQGHCILYRRRKSSGKKLTGLSGLLQISSHIPHPLVFCF